MVVDNKKCLCDNIYKLSSSFVTIVWLLNIIYDKITYQVSSL